ncbi:MAG: hypothetical protein ACRC92_21535 [Peptostreptococcaceae bacterium]
MLFYVNNCNGCFEVVIGNKTVIGTMVYIENKEKQYYDEVLFYTNVTNEEIEKDIREHLAKIKL